MDWHFIDMCNIWKFILNFIRIPATTYCLPNHDQKWCLAFVLVLHPSRKRSLMTEEGWVTHAGEAGEGSSFPSTLQIYQL